MCFAGCSAANTDGFKVTNTILSKPVPALNVMQFGYLCGMIARVSSCGVLSGWRAGQRAFAAAEYFNDAHGAATVRAWFSQCEGDDLGGWRVILFGYFCPEQPAVFAILAFRLALASMP